MPPVGAKTKPKEPDKAPADSSSNGKKPGLDISPKLPSQQPAVKREVRYKEFSALIFDKKKPFTAELAKTFLGWTPASAGAKDRVYEIGGEKAFLLNNANRPLRSTAHIPEQIMRREWYQNGESIIIGITGIVLDGQHRLIGLIEADFDYRKNPEKWKKHGWDKPPSIECLVVVGVSEERKVIHTINTGYSRTLSDVVYMEEVLKKYKAPDRKTLANMLQYASRFVWRRTSAGENASEAKYRTHLESIDYIHRHKRLIEAVKHIFEENQGDEKNSKLIQNRYRINLGDCAGLLYLMGSSATEPVTSADEDHYFNHEPANEKHLNWKLWDKALKYWSLLAAGKPEIKGVLNALAAFEGGGTKAMRMGVLVKGWNAWVNGKDLNSRTLALSFEDDGEGGSILVEQPSCGGIDVVSGTRFEGEEEGEAQE